MEIFDQKEFWTLNSNFLKQSDKADFVDTVESEYINKNPNEFVVTSKNNKISPTTFKVDEFKIILRSKSF